jgi:hypothetical protein
LGLAVAAVDITSGGGAERHETSRLQRISSALRGRRGLAHQVREWPGECRADPNVDQGEMVIGQNPE